nr:hypothetical protein [Patescibacteria group bacterium]
MKKQICHSLITLLAVVFLGSSFSAHPAFAESGDTFDSFDNFSCSAGLGYVGAINTQNESYDLYLKLGKPLQSEKVTLTYSQSTNCKKFKNITANGITWSKIGTINADSTNKASFTLEANFINNLPDANRPTLMLVPTKKPPCKPKKQCVISSIQGVTTHIEPTGTSFNQEDLHIVKVIDPKTDSIASVDYFVDNDFMYSSTNPEPFDKRYMPIGSHTVYTINNYKSGQKVVKSEVLDQGVASGFKNFVFTIFYKNKSALDILTGLVIILS